jgi:hypothetical protein
MLAIMHKTVHIFQIKAVVVEPAAGNDHDSNDHDRG